MFCKFVSDSLDNNNIWVTGFCVIQKYDFSWFATIQYNALSVQLSSPTMSSWSPDTYLKDTCHRSSTASIVGLTEWSWRFILFWAWRNDLFHGFGIISILQETKGDKIWHLILMIDKILKKHYTYIYFFKHEAFLTIIYLTITLFSFW